MSDAKPTSLSELARKHASSDMLVAACEDRKKSRAEILASLRRDLASLNLHLDDFDDLTAYAVRQINGHTASRQDLETLKAQTKQLKQAQQANAELQKRHDDLQAYCEELKKWGNDWQKRALDLKNEVAACDEIIAGQKEKLNRKLAQWENDPGRFDELVLLRKRDGAYVHAITELRQQLEAATQECQFWKSRVGREWQIAKLGHKQPAPAFDPGDSLPHGVTGDP